MICCALISSLAMGTNGTHPAVRLGSLRRTKGPSAAARQGAVEPQRLIRSGWLSGFFVCPSQQRAHVRDAVCRARAQQARITRQPRYMVRLHRTAEARLAQGLHYLVHVQIAVVREGLDEMRKRARYVAEMHFEDLLAAAETADHLEDVLAHAVSAFRPRTHAEREPPVRAVAGDLLRAVVPVVVSEKFGHAVHLGNRRDRPDGVRVSRPPARPPAAPPS